MEKQITFYDKMQAFIRLADKGLVKEMTIKGSYTNSLPKLYGMTQLKKSDDGHTFVSVGEVDDIKKFYEKLSSPVTVIPPWEHIETSAVSDKEMQDPAALIRDGKYLAVCVDLTRKKNRILDDLKNLIDTLIPYIGNETMYYSDGRGAEKSFKYPIWHIYDKCTRTKKPNFTAVARELSGESGQAPYNERLKEHLEAVRRSYKRACEIIKNVQEEITKKNV